MNNINNALPKGFILRGSAHTYRVERVLGQGSFGITYLATTKVVASGSLGSFETTINVAVKEFFMSEVNGRENSTVTSGSQGGLFDNYKRKFAREADNLSKLSHPHIVRVLELFEANNTFYYSMEYCESGSLDEEIERRGGLPEKDALNYIQQISDALTFMHNRQVLHLDLKPSNIMRRTPQEVILIDFGLSKHYDPNGNPESSTTIGGGTPGYSPIEQANYKSGDKLSVTLDVYALGATLYKMLTGKRPPVATDIFNEGFPREELEQKGVSGATISCIEKAMSSAKRARYQSVEEFVSALSNSSSSFAALSEVTEFISPKSNDTNLSKPKSSESHAKRESQKLKYQLDENEDKKQRRHIKIFSVIGVVIVVACLSLLLGRGCATPSSENAQQEIKKSDITDDAPLKSTNTLSSPTETKSNAKKSATNAKKSKMSTDGQLKHSDEEEKQRDAARKVQPDKLCKEQALVVLYNEGGVAFDANDYKKALKCWTDAAEQGQKDAQYRLGDMYACGIGVAENDTTAAYWFNKAAEQGQKDAQYELGYMYYFGVAVSQNYELAAKWIGMSAKQNLSAAQYLYGSMYEYGKGVAKDYSEAVKWYRKAANQNNSVAKEALSRLESHGIVVEEETIEDDQPFIKVEEMPTFQGGDLNVFRAWVQKRVNYPQIALESNISGRVLLQFIIERDGTLTNIQILQSPDSSLSDEAIRVLKTSPKWKPGKQRNKPVRVKYTLPLDFRIAN